MAHPGTVITCGGSRSGGSVMNWNWPPGPGSGSIILAQRSGSGSGSDSGSDSGSFLSTKVSTKLHNKSSIPQTCPGRIRIQIQILPPGSGTKYKPNQSSPTLGCVNMSFHHLWPAHQHFSYFNVLGAQCNQVTHFQRHTNVSYVLKPLAYMEKGK